MDHATQELRVVGVNKDEIEKDDAFPAAWRYPFRLLEPPDELWAEVFEQVYSTNLYSSMKRGAYLSGNCIVVILADSDDKQHQADIVKRAVDDTNAEYKRERERLAMREAREERARREEEGRQAKLRDDADRLNF